MSQRTNEADVAAVTDVVRAYYDGSMEGDEMRLVDRILRALQPIAVFGAGADDSFATLFEK